MSCLHDESPCTISGAAADAPITDAAFALFDGEGQLFYDATTPSNGLDWRGKPCSEFSLEGNDKCPFRYNLVWSAICVPGECTSPDVKVTATLLFAPGDNKIVINTENYSVPILYRDAK